MLDSREIKKIYFEKNQANSENQATYLAQDKNFQDRGSSQLLQIENSAEQRTSRESQL